MSGKSYRAWIGLVGLIVLAVVTGACAPSDSDTAQPEPAEEATAVSPEQFAIYMVQSGSAGHELNQYTFPYADVVNNSDPDAFGEILAQLPGSQYTSDGYQIFRTKDRALLAAGESVVAGGNKEVLVLPNDQVEAAGGPEAAFLFFHAKVRVLQQ